MIPSLVALAGLTYDGGQIFAARREANNVASAAARAGANVVTEDSLFLGQPALSPPDAVAEAEQFAVAQGMDTADADVPQDHFLTIEVTDEFQTVFLAVIGIESITVEGSARATVRSAVEDGDDG